MKPQNQAATTEKMWNSAKQIIETSPQITSGTEFETQIMLMFVILDVEITFENIAIAYHSAVENENLDWFLDRLENQKYKATQISKKIR